jgi:rubrerythrin
VLLQYQSLKDYGQYVRHAKNTGRQDLASFFEQVMTQEFERAKRCHELQATVHTSL